MATDIDRKQLANTHLQVGNVSWESLGKNLGLRRRYLVLGPHAPRRSSRACSSPTRRPASRVLLAVRCEDPEQGSCGEHPGHGGLPRRSPMPLLPSAAFSVG